MLEFVLVLVGVAVTVEVVGRLEVIVEEEESVDLAGVRK